MKTYRIVVVTQDGDQLFLTREIESDEDLKSMIADFGARGILSIEAGEYVYRPPGRILRVRAIEIEPAEQQSSEAPRP